MQELLDLDRFPLDEPEGARLQALLAQCRRELERDGMFSLAGLIRCEALVRSVAEVEPVLARDAFKRAATHDRNGLGRGDVASDAHGCYVRSSAISKTCDSSRVRTGSSPSETS